MRGRVRARTHHFAPTIRKRCVKSRTLRLLSIGHIKPNGLAGVVRDVAEVVPPEPPPGAAPRRGFAGWLGGLAPPLQMVTRELGG